MTISGLSGCQDLMQTSQLAITATVHTILSTFYLNIYISLTHTLPNNTTITYLLTFTPTLTQLYHTANQFSLFSHVTVATLQSSSNSPTYPGISHGGINIY